MVDADAANSAVSRGSTTDNTDRLLGAA